MFRILCDGLLEVCDALLRLAFGEHMAAFIERCVPFACHLLAKGETEKSIAYLEQAIAQDPEHYQAYYDLGLAHLRLLHLAEAERAFQKSIDLTKGNFAPAQFGLAAILSQNADILHLETLL